MRAARAMPTLRIDNDRCRVTEWQFNPSVGEYAFVEIELKG